MTINRLEFVEAHFCHLPSPGFSCKIWPLQGHKLIGELGLVLQRKIDPFYITKLCTNTNLKNQEGKYIYACEGTKRVREKMSS